MRSDENPFGVLQDGTISLRWAVVKKSDLCCTVFKLHLGEGKQKLL